MKSHFMLFALGFVASLILFTNPAVAKMVVAVHADRNDPVYKCGEQATFTINVSEDGNPVTEGEVSVTLSLDGGRTINQKTITSGQASATVSGTLEEPGFLLCAATVRDGDVTRTDYNSAAFEPERIQTAAILPDNFDEFWAAGRAHVDTIPMDLQFTSMPKFSDEKQETFKLSLANIDNTRIYGFLSIPKGKEPPYPAFVSVPGAGVGVPAGPMKAQAVAGALSLVMGVHTHDLGLPGKEYEALREGSLRDYYFQGAPDRERYFYRRAILGIDRAVRYLISRPDWDGKHLVYFGSSQGGAMGLILAGLNPEISAIGSNVPGLCDLNGARAGRQAGYPPLVANASDDEREQYAQMVEYFDAVNFARKIRCPVLMSVGFKDRICNPSSVYAAYNVIQAPKRMIHGTESGHWMAWMSLERFGAWVNGQLGLGELLPPMAE